MNFSAIEQQGNYNFDSFLKASSAVSSSTPTKRSRSKTIPNKQEFGSLNLAQQYEILHNVAKEHTRVNLDFEALGMAIKTSMTSNSLRKAFSLEKTGAEECSDKAENISDPDERAYLLELLEEQAERSEAILKAEDERLKKEMELLN